jgi:AAA family ATP:ADP antiporter
LKSKTLFKFSDVSSEKIWMAGSMATAAFFIIFGYELLRSATTTLFNQAYGVENLPIVMSFIPFALVAILYIYNRLLTATGPRRTLLITSIGCAVTMVLGFVFISKGFRFAAALLYVFREAYVLLIIEQYWSFLNSRLGSEAAKKLSGPVIGISSIGGILGGLTLSYFVQRLGTVTMLPLAGALMFPALFFSDLAYAKGGEPKPESAKAETEPAKSLGLSLFRQHRSLVTMLLVVVTSQVLANVLMIQFQNLLQLHYPEPDLQTAVSGKYYATLNAASGVLQFLAVPLLLRFVPYKTIHRGIPVVHLAACAYMFFYPSLFSAGLSYFLFKSIDYSVFKAAKEIFYIPFSFDVRYRAKQLIDTFGYRFGKGGSSLVFSFIQRSILSPSTYALTGLAAAFFWLFLVLPSNALQNDAKNFPKK